MKESFLEAKKVVSFTPVAGQKVISGATVPSELSNNKNDQFPVSDIMLGRVSIVKKMVLRKSIISKKLLKAVNKSASRVMVTLTDKRFSNSFTSGSKRK